MTTNTPLTMTNTPAADDPAAVELPPTQPIDITPFLSRTS